MEFFKNVVDYFDGHPGYELLMSFVALVFSIIPYVIRFFAKRFRLKITPIAYRYFIFNNGRNKNLVIQIAITNLSETPCTITQAFFIAGEQEKYVSAASENDMRASRAFSELHQTKGGDNEKVRSGSGQVATNLCRYKERKSESAHRGAFLNAAGLSGARPKAAGLCRGSRGRMRRRGG